MTIYDISQKAGVSIATVSRVLNGSDKVSPKTRKKVLDVMEKYAYTPNAFARGLGLSTSHTVGILCADSSDLYLAKAVYYLEQMLRAKGYDSILCCCGYDLDNRVKSVNLLLSKKVDSIIFVGSNFIEAKEEDNAYIRELAKTHPVMILNADYIAPNVYSCLCDDYHAMYSAAEELIGAGRRRISYIYNSTSYSCSKKLTGYIDAMNAHGLQPMTEFIDRRYEASDEVLETAERLKKLHKDTKGGLDAVLSAEDGLALGAVKFAHRAGLEIPKDIAIIGYNNSLLAVSSEPELTSIDNRLELLCRQLVTNLTEILAGSEIPRKTIYSGILVKRGTT
jgi:LacI family transcriptional regulator/LacI family asc operon transcriptional repressor